MADEALEAVLRGLNAVQITNITLAMVDQAIDFTYDYAKNLKPKDLKTKMLDGSFNLESKRAWRGVEDDRMWAWLRHQGIVKTPVATVEDIIPGFVQDTPAEPSPVPEPVKSVKYTDAEIELRQLMDAAFKLELKLPNSSRVTTIPMKEFLRNWFSFGAEAIPVRHVYKPYSEFLPDEHISVEFLLRRLVYEYTGDPVVVDKAQATAAVLKQLVATGMFKCSKELGVVWSKPDGKPKDIPEQRRYHRRVLSLSLSDKVIALEKLINPSEGTCKGATS